MEKFIGFEDDVTLEGTIKMGEMVVEDSFEKNEEDLNSFINFCNGNPYIVFDKKDIVHFIELISYHSRLGYDVYTLSFKLDTQKIGAGIVQLVYNNGNVLAVSELKVQAVEGVSSCVISVDTFLRVAAASRGYICLFEEENNLFGYLFGGRVYIETFKVDIDICSKEYIMEYIQGRSESLKLVDPEFVKSLRMLYDITRTGTRIEEKAIYFIDDFSYIYSGVVMGRFKGFDINITLQDLDISTLSKFFIDVTTKIEINDHGVFMKYSSGGRTVYIAKRGLKLSDDMKYVDINEVNSVELNVNDVTSIVNFLVNLPNNSGLLDILPAETGVVLNCLQKATDNISTFNVKGIVKGNGIQGVRMQLGVLKTFLKLFHSQVVLKVQNNKLYVSGAEGCIVIFGG